MKYRAAEQAKVISDEAGKIALGASILYGSLTVRPGSEKKAAQRAVALYMKIREEAIDAILRKLQEEDA